jgi:hypothetical protein
MVCLPMLSGSSTETRSGSPWFPREGPVSAWSGSRPPALPRLGLAGTSHLVDQSTHRWMPPHTCTQDLWR